MDKYTDDRFAEIMAANEIDLNLIEEEFIAASVPNPLDIADAQVAAGERAFGPGVLVWFTSKSGQQRKGKVVTLSVDSVHTILRLKSGRQIVVETKSLKVVR